MIPPLRRFCTKVDRQRQAYARTLPVLKATLYSMDTGWIASARQAAKAHM